MRTLFHFSDRTKSIWITLLMGASLVSWPVSAAPKWVISGNENKIDLTSGVSRLVPNAAPDTLTLLNFESFPPVVVHVTNVSNSVLGPPSNVAVTADGRLALVADSVQIDPVNPGKWFPAHRVHVVDLTVNPPRVVGEGRTGAQPSGLAIAPNGRLVLVANRAGGSVSVLRLEGTALTWLSDVPLALSADEVSDVTIAPDGTRAFVSVREKNHLRELRIEGEKVTATERKFSTYGRPYRVLTTPDGQLLLTAGIGAGNGPDMDALTVIDLEATPPRTVDLVKLGISPESIELSPDGRWLAAVMMNGSNLAPQDSLLQDHGEVVLLERAGRTFRHRQTVKVGRIPEGAAFTPDGRHLVVQCHPERNLWLFEVTKRGLRDTGLRISVPGMPSGMRAQGGR
ncbi:MAG: hypothetical protein JNN07_23485 [Verrucomicrobiales bacterium]|nr:hypothetical protein [Verrucomicrobiales bacterium]